MNSSAHPQFWAKGKYWFILQVFKKPFPFDLSSKHIKLGNASDEPQYSARHLDALKDDATPLSTLENISKSSQHVVALIPNHSALHGVHSAQRSQDQPA